MYVLRSILFNFLFYVIWSPLIVLGLAPCLLLPRGFAVWVATLYQDGPYYLAKYILGIDYELRGAEHRPTSGAYIVASKHQSAYETLLLYQLFGDPTIVLKKELLSIPVFGWFLKKLEVIAIDRGNSAQAKVSLSEGAQRMNEQNRPIIIYPQGTRVKVDETTADKPYKGGVSKLYAAGNLPILPVAINTGLYWPRKSFWKYPGKVVIEFLPLIPAGLPSEEITKKLENIIEPASAALVAEGRAAK
jgi:1-acyl-sn-glycerol-3-phosphate acyltransferase